MLRDNVVRGPAKGLFSLGVIAGILALAGIASVLLPMLPAASISEGTVTILLAFAFFFLLLCAIVGSATAQSLGSRQMNYRLVLAMWWVLLVDEVYFARLNTSYAMGKGQFSIFAYGEAMMWGACMLILLAISLKQPAYLRQMVSGSTKWLAAFILLCTASAAWAPGKLYTLIWSFKLILVFLLLQMCSSLIEDVGDITLFFKVTAGAFVFLSIVPVIQAIGDPAGFFYEGRLNADPDLLGPTAASFMLMSLILFTITKKRYYVPAGLVGALVMFLAFGKAGIVGGFIGVALFVMLQKKVVRSLGLLLALAGLAMVIIAVTPLSGYLHAYQGASTLTGRTMIWRYAITAMRNKPLFGYGYLATYFSFENNSGLVSGAVHLHNGFIEVAYNNGIVGELLLLTVHFMIVRNIFRAIRTSTILRRLRPGNQQVWIAYLLVIGTLALYVHTFIQGLFGGHFGGRCMTPYMLWLGVFMLADVTRRVSENMLNRGTSSRERLSAEPTFRTLTIAPRR